MPVVRPVLIPLFVCLAGAPSWSRASQVVCDKLEKSVSASTVVLEIVVESVAREATDSGERLRVTGRTIAVMQGEVPSSIDTFIYRVPQLWTRRADGTLVGVSPILPCSGIEDRLELGRRYLLFSDPGLYRLESPGIGYYRAEPMDRRDEVLHLLTTLRGSLTPTGH